MVKGFSRQVIVVHSPEEKLFEQAIFILKDNALKEGVTDDLLLKEAQKVIRGSCLQGKKRRWFFHGAFWASAGALSTGAVWLMCTLL